MKVTLSVVLAAVGLHAEAAQPTTRNRAEIPAQYRWDFSAIYPGWDAWEAGMKELEAKMNAFAALKGSLGKGPADLLQAYRALDEIGILQYRVFRYPQLQRDTDTRAQDVAGKFQRVSALFARFGTITAWFTPELLAIPQAQVEQWIRATPDLAPYRFPIQEEFRKQKHVLDERGEKLLSYAARANETPRSVYTELSTSDIKFPKVTLSDGAEITVSPANYQRILHTRREQADRAKAFAAHIGTYAATANTYAAIYDGVLQRSWFMAQARNFSDTLQAGLEDSAVPPEVVTTLIDTVRKGVGPLRRYAGLRKKLLGVQEYHLYDAFVPIFRSDKTYDFDASKDLVLASVAPLGEEYVGRYRKWMSGGKLDVYENEGKRSGAYSADVYGVGPYVLMNYNDTMDALFTFAHEAGHAMHSVLSSEAQPFATSQYTIFVAEVASTTNERFLLEQLLAKTTDPKERFLLLQHAVDEIVGTFYTQVLFADFELQAHKLAEKGEPVTSEVLSDIYMKLLRDYYGDAVTVDDAYKYTWTRIPHFYNSPYYVYQYATCFASSARLFKDMTSGEPAARKAATGRYLALLKSGGNDEPIKQLQKAGVDLTQRATVQAVIDQMGELVTRMEAEAAKISR
ncbi:MAG TPA: oligoendopeptidase F [Burkholderiales bacterium]|nr:oligoendopeptidase F [Burkholderiales bacterium]